MGDLRRVNPNQAKPELRAFGGEGRDGVPVADPLDPRREGGRVDAEIKKGRAKETNISELAISLKPCRGFAIALLEREQP